MNNDKVIALFEEIDESVGSEVLVTKSYEDVQVSSETFGTIRNIFKRYSDSLSHDVSRINEVPMDGHLFYYLNIKPL